jgi:hypothetical protein
MLRSEQGKESEEGQDHTGESTTAQSSVQGAQLHGCRSCQYDCVDFWWQTQAVMKLVYRESDGRV